MGGVVELLVQDVVTALSSTLSLRREVGPPPPSTVVLGGSLSHFRAHVKVQRMTGQNMPGGVSVFAALSPVQVAARTTLTVFRSGARVREWLTGRTRRDVRVFEADFDARHYVAGSDPGLVRALLQEPAVREPVVEICAAGASVSLGSGDLVSTRLSWTEGTPEAGFKARAVAAVQALARLAPAFEQLRDLEPLDVHDVDEMGSSTAASGAPVAVPDVMTPETGLLLKKGRRGG